MKETCKIGKRGAVIIPSSLRKRFGMEDGSLVIIEEREDGILFRPAVAVPIESYTLERVAEFILNNAVDSAEYESACKKVREMGLDPADIQHQTPL